mmetsp:Transcript_1176/g.1863  ORF Transcript_1176/g.1863 Transcript_1176/m.1863 type:complete len:92 (-) Transcript_1176:85-360(-)
MHGTLWLLLQIGMIGDSRTTEDAAAGWRGWCTLEIGIGVKACIINVRECHQCRPTSGLLRTRGSRLREFRRKGTLRLVLLPGMTARFVYTR